MPRYSEEEALAAVQASRSYAETLRRLGLCTTGANRHTLRIWIARWGMSTEHFDARAAQRSGLGSSRQPIAEILIKGSTYSRNHLKKRLYREGLKDSRCEMCGQGELWNGRTMGLILDHINGVRDDHRIENLRILCPNCAATLDTHCGRKNRLDVQRTCARCAASFRPNRPDQKYCSVECGQRYLRTKGRPNPKLRRVERPAYEQLMSELAATSYLAVGRRYGVSDNAVRKWVRQYERERGRAAAGAPGADQSAG